MERVGGHEKAVKARKCFTQLDVFSYGINPGVKDTAIYSVQRGLDSIARCKRTNISLPVQHKHEKNKHRT